MSALAAYDIYGQCLHEAREPLMMREETGAARPLPVDTWLGPLTTADEQVLDRAVAPVLDVGCGPGRHVLALARRGVLALGVDAAPAAVRLARDRGAAVIEASVFGGVPGAGTWGSALLLDGNIGIGGCPQTLLRRLGSLIGPEGFVLVELDAPRTRARTGRVRLERAGATSSWFPWGQVAADRIESVAGSADMRVDDLWQQEGRWFACLAAAERVVQCSGRQVTAT